MTGKQIRNVWGQIVTQSGHIDRRTENKGRPPKGPPEFFVRFKPNDVKPWHVMKRSSSGEAVRRISRHYSEERARTKARNANEN